MEYASGEPPPKPIDTMPLSAIVESDRDNAAAGWAVVAVLAAAALLNAVAVDLLWTGFAVVTAALAVAPAVVYRDPAVLPPAEVLAVVALPPILELANLPDVVVQAATYLAVGGIALLAVVELHLFSSVEMPADFAAVLVVLLTMATAAVWSILRFAADAFLGTGFIQGKVPLMWDLVLATAVGVFAGPLVWAYLGWHGSVGAEAFAVGDGEIG